MKIVYSRHYDIGFFGLERLHPFDSRKYSRAWRCLKREFGSRLRQLHVSGGYSSESYKHVFASVRAFVELF